MISNHELFIDYHQITLVQLILIYDFCKKILVTINLIII